MSTLHLDSLEIKNFRCFEHLVIEKLGRVNLIVGKNSVGKTCLLEAILLFASKGNPFVLHQILSNRDERRSRGRKIAEDIEAAISEIKNIFYGRRIDIGRSFLRLGETNSDDRSLTIKLDFYGDSLGLSEPRTLRVLSPEEYEQVDEVELRLSISSGVSEERAYSIPLDLSRFSYRAIKQYAEDEIAFQFLPARGPDANKVAALWDSIALTKLEAEVLSALQIIDSNIERFSVVGEQDSRSDRYPIVKLGNIDDPVPLKSLGDGMLRSLGIALALVNSKNGMLLIDEFENGLHHSVQANLWKLIFAVSEKLGIQVFATTHSWDCVEAFQQAAAEDQNEEAMLIRLQKKRSGEGIEAVLYDERRLTLATEENIEVR